MGLSDRDMDCVVVSNTLFRKYTDEMYEQRLPGGFLAGLDE
jgi:hypothetical protein